MKLKLVTWDGDLTQFLVEADNDHDAINKAIEANLKIDYWEDNEPEMRDPTTYEVDDVNFSLLTEIIARTDWMGTYGEAVVFND